MRYDQQKRAKDLVADLHGTSPVQRGPIEAEINEYEGKEEAYSIKRQELLSVENQFRNVHDEHIRKIDTGQMSDESYGLLIKGFEG